MEQLELMPEGQELGFVNLLRRQPECQRKKRQSKPAERDPRDGHIEGCEQKENKREDQKDKV
jgi:hypothetical protein